MSVILEINTATLEPHEAAAVVAFMNALHPGSVKSQALASVALPVEGPKVPAGLVVPVAKPDGVALADQLMAEESARVAKAAAEQTQGAKPDDHDGPYPRINANGIAVDAEGIPWDTRIHTPSKTLLKNNTWTIKRLMDPGHVATVKAELKALQDAPSIPVGVAGPAAGLVVPVAAAAAGPVIQVEGGAAVVPVAVVVAEAAAVVPAGPASFADVMGRVVDLTQAGIPLELINRTMAPLGLAQPRDVAGRPDLAPAAMAALAVLG